MWVMVLLSLFFFAVPVQLMGQEEEPEIKIADAMESMLNDHPYRFTIFRVRPDVKVNSGYDSNGLYSSSQEVGDYFYSVAPGGSFALRFGSRAFLVLDEYLNFVYYNRLEQLRDIFNTTEAHFVTGSRKTLLTLHGGYVSKKEGRLDSEFDVPAQLKRTWGGSAFEIGMTPKLDLRLNFSAAQYVYEQDLEISSLFPPPPDHNVLSYGTSMDYKVHPRIAVSGGGGVSTTQFLDNSNRRNSYRIFGGLRLFFSGARGDIRLGYVETELESNRKSTLKGLLVATSLDFLFRDKITASVFVRRDHDVSRFGAGNFRTTTEGGVHGSIPFGRKFFVDASYRIGKNNYGRVVNAAEDHFQAIGSGLNYFLMRNLSLRSGFTYYRRDLNSRVNVKNRFTYEIGINYVLSPQ